MAVQVWIGDKPEHPNERRAIVALANGLERLENLYLLLANYNVGGRTIDLTIIKQDAIFIIELKHCDGKVFGSVNGPWFLESANGERKRLNPGRKNPYNQVISYYYSLTNFLNDHRAEMLSAYKAAQINFRSCRRLVVIAPGIQAGSELTLDWKVELKGLDELPAFLVTERSPDIDLTEAEMLAIPRLLGCTRWRDINELIAGVLPTWHADPPRSAPDQPAAPTDPAPPAPAPRTPSLSPFWRALHTASGPLATAMSMLALLLLLLVLWQPGEPVPPPPIRSGQGLLTPNSPPAGGIFPGAVELTPPPCVWSEYQMVGKRWDSGAQRWISVGVGGSLGELAPEIVVTLERVEYCDEEIRLTWSVRNTTESLVRFPLHDTNMSIRDPVGNDYTIDNSRSQPDVLLIEPGNRAQGVAIVPRPVSQNAPALLIRLKDEPFGEASWLVSLEGN